MGKSDFGDFVPDDSVEVSGQPLSGVELPTANESSHRAEVLPVLGIEITIPLYFGDSIKDDLRGQFTRGYSISLKSMDQVLK